MHDQLEPFAQIERASWQEIERRIAALSPARTGSVVSLALADLDCFKAMNQAIGHARGDLVLAALAPRLRESLGDGLVRVRGDAFAALLVGVDARTARRRAEAALAAVLREPLLSSDPVLYKPQSRDEYWPNLYGPLPDGSYATDGAYGRAGRSGLPGWELVEEPMLDAEGRAAISAVVGSISIGLASAVVGGTGWTDLLRAADMALYEAKGAGRATVRVATSPLSSPGASAISERRSDRG